MKVAIVCAKKDIASVNIFHYIINTNPNISLLSFEKESVYIDDPIDADFIIFVSRHQSKSNLKCLTTHTTGNFSKAEFGGIDNTLSFASAYAVAESLKLQSKATTINYDYVQEVTHHGPYTEKPSLFMEIGSDEEAWNNIEAAKIVAKNAVTLAESICKYNSIEELNNSKYKIAIGIGGLHNSPNFRRLIMEYNIAFSHICPKYMLEYINKETIQEMIKKTVEKVDFIVVDWKGLGEYKEKIQKIIKEINLPFYKITELKK